MPECRHTFERDPSGAWACSRCGLTLAAYQSGTIHEGAAAVRDIIAAALRDPNVRGQERTTMQHLLLLVAVEYSGAARELLTQF